MLFTSDGSRTQKNTRTLQLGYVSALLCVCVCVCARVCVYMNMYVWAHAYLYKCVCVGTCVEQVNVGVNKFMCRTLQYSVICECE